MSEVKPTKVEIGSRWENPACDKTYNPQTVVAYKDYEDSGGVVPGVLLRVAGGGRRHWPISDMLNWRYLGGPQPSPSMPGPVMESDTLGLPAHCLVCGGKKGESLHWVCVLCLYDKTAEANLYLLVSDWKAGARDFPRRPPTEETGGAPKTAPVPVTAESVVKPRHDWMMSHVEARTSVADGLRPASRIDAVPSRQPPEPWRPSVDEYDLLPDVGTSWSDTRGSGRP